jgi:hypothetical protein
LVYALNDRGVNWFSASVQDAHTPEAELIAVAQLMKAAPDLLAALKELDAATDRQRRYGQPISDAQKKARAAITKATGVQP